MILITKNRSYILKLGVPSKCINLLLGRSRLARFQKMSQFQNKIKNPMAVWRPFLIFLKFFWSLGSKNTFSKLFIGNNFLEFVLKTIVFKNILRCFQFFFLLSYFRTFAWYINLQFLQREQTRKTIFHI